MRNKLLILIAMLILVSANAFGQSGGTFTIVESVVGSGGTQNASGGGFSVSSTVGQALAGTNLSGGVFDINSGFWVPPVSGVGTEGDVAPRPGGDAAVLSNDVVQVRRYFNGTATADTDLGEFQRADSAPRATSGDGLLASNDIVQTRRYQNGTDITQQAAGPIAENGNPFYRANGKNQFVAPRELRVESTNAVAGQIFTLNIRVDAMGDEAEYGLRLNYQASKLSNPVIGAGNAGATVRSCNVAVAGVVNCSVGGFTNNLPGSADPGIGEIPAGNNQILITITFNVLMNAAPGPSPLTLSNVNTSNDNADLLTITGTNGAVMILGPTAASVSVSGRVLTADGRGIRNARVVLTGENGELRTTLSSSFGYFRFEDVPVGETYVFSVGSKRFTFSQSSQVRSIVEETDDINFVADN